jgi:hypothetical protein
MHMDDLDHELTELVDEQTATDLRALWAWLSRMLPDDPDASAPPSADLSEPEWSDPLEDLSTRELADLGLAAVQALNRAHAQTDHDDGFAAIRYSVFFTTPPEHERIRMRGALDLACELAKIRYNSGLLAAQAHLDGPLGAPAHDDRVELCRQLLLTLVAYALTASPNPDLEAARVLLAKICGQSPT